MRTMKKLAAVAVVAVLGASTPGRGFAAEATADGAATRAAEHDCAMQRYERLLKAYEKDRTAYEADPSVWTAAVPRPPEKPAAPAVSEGAKT